MLKRILYGGGALGVLVGAYLLGSATLGQILAQSPGPSPTAPAHVAGQDHEEQSEAAEAQALQSQAKITPDQAKAAALAQFPGASVQKVELDNENGTVVYSVQLTDSSGKGWDVKVDAGTGMVLRSEADGPEGAEHDDGVGESGAED